jgi:hypothetical protein
MAVPMLDSCYRLYFEGLSSEWTEQLSEVPDSSERACRCYRTATTQESKRMCCLEGWRRRTESMCSSSISR